MAHLTLLFSLGDSCDVAVAYVDCDASVACIFIKESVAICMLPKFTVAMLLFQLIQGGFILVTTLLHL